jgi:hypothetical protein
MRIEHQDRLTLAATLTSWREEIACMWRFTKNNGITEGFHHKMNSSSAAVTAFETSSMIASASSPSAANPSIRPQPTNHLTPSQSPNFDVDPATAPPAELVEPRGFEPLTSSMPLWASARVRCHSSGVTRLFGSLLANASGVRAPQFHYPLNRISPRPAAGRSIGEPWKSELRHRCSGCLFFLRFELLLVGNPRWRFDA